MTNYRPILLLTVFPKHSKKLSTTPAHKQHTDLWTDGFSKGIQPENPAFRLTDYVLKSINQKNVCGRSFLWLCKDLIMWIMKFC